MRNNEAINAIWALHSDGESATTNASSIIMTTRFTPTARAIRHISPDRKLEYAGSTEMPNGHVVKPRHLPSRDLLPRWCLVHAALGGPRPRHADSGSCRGSENHR